MAPDTDNKPEANDEFKASETTPDQPDSSSVNTDNTEEINKISEEQTSPKPEPVINNEPTSLKPDNNEKPNHHGFKPELILWPSLRARLGSRARPIASFVIILVIIILGAVSYGLTKNKTDKPILASSFKAPVKTFQLVSTVPGKNATNVNAASQLTLNFNLPVNATKLTNNMFITPTLNGVFKQGSSPDQVVFKPSTPLTKGVKYSVMINGTLQNVQGTKLGVPIEYSFTTSIPSDSISFQDQNGLLDYVTSLPSGQKENYTLNFGNQVSPTATVTLYKGSVNDLLASLVYSSSTTNSPAEFSDLAVSTSGLTQVSATPNLKDGSSYSVQQPDGLYVAVATDSSGKEVGFVWVDFSDFGVMLRQDDQKTVLDAQLFASSSDVTAEASFYSLNGSVSNLGQMSVNGLTTAPYGFNDNLDMVVATNGSETTVTPVNVLESGGDIRVDQNLSTAQTIYGITDKPSYNAGDKINIAGYVRLDNDAQYVAPTSGVVKLYVASFKGGPQLASLNAYIDSNGMFTTSIPSSSSWLTSGDAFDQFQIYAASVSGNPNNDASIASFSLAAKSPQTDNITVTFNKSSYLPSDQITASIKALDSSGQPLANTALQIHLYSQDYYENDPASNLANFGYVGNPLASVPATVQLNANGEGTLNIDPKWLPNDGNSQMVTLQVNQGTQTGVGAAGGATAIIHQGNAYVTFGPTRQQIPTGQNLLSAVYVNQLNNSPLGSASVTYNLIDESNSKQLASGTATTDSNGFTAINIQSGNLATNGDPMALQVQLKDQYGNIINSSNYYSVANQTSESYDSSGTGLLDLSVSGTSGHVSVGDTVNLNINSPSTIKALVTMDRGRIYNPKMVTLQAGDNNYSFTVDSSLAPSFTLTFSYFLNGVYHSEGILFNVSNPAQTASVYVVGSSGISANKPVTFQVTTNDNTGSGLPTSLIVDVVSSNAYSLTNRVNPDIYATLFDPRPIMTSSSSSLSPVGSGGGRCGGGGAGLPSFANAIGTTLYWNPELTTDGSGQASFTLNPPAGNWTINVYAMSGNTQVGSQSTSFTAN